MGISPIVSGFKNLRRNTLLHAHAIVRDSKNLNISVLQKLAANVTTGLSKYRDDILRACSKDVLVMQYLRLACLVPC
jgi:hypothetical protein